MSKRNNHEPEKEARKKLRLHDEPVREYSAVDALLELFGRHNEMDWGEYAHEDGIDLLADFAEEDWQALKSLLPSMTADEWKKLLWCLYAGVRRHQEILQEMIRTDDPEIIRYILSHICCMEWQLASESAAEILEKGLRILRKEDFFDSMHFFRAYDNCRTPLPEDLRNRIEAARR